MVHRFLILLFVTAALLPGCRSKKTGDGERPALGAEAEAPDPLAERAPSTARPNDNETSLYGRAVMRVFGIKIPTGMAPTRGPENVYRFEGKLPPVRVATLIRPQINAEQEVPEGNGFLFRFATVKQGRSNAAGDRGIAVRISQTAEGSNLDIWLEREHSALPGTAAVSDFPSPRNPRPTRTVVTPQTREAERRHRALLMSALRKIQTGEALTPEEAASGVFD